ncbi:MAG: hypothetical protein DMD28_06835 [Gemmatimonadetes bacterium]|nr:MAG: hypothetical protein DMD28_06835 [Gemmatimonadota bacterium]
MALAVVLTAALLMAGPPTSSFSPSPTQALRWRFVGPYRAGWATVALGVPNAPNTFYFGGAGGGVWKTTDAGRTWHAQMQHETAAAVGALALAPSNPAILYAGTGQVDARYDIMAGEGVYRSADGGETWTQVGLAETRHIGAILIDPADANRVLVAALGHVFGPNPERGVFLTSDGGQHWEQVLHVDDATGAVDLASDPTHPAAVYAAVWQMRMHPWLDYFMPQAGPGSGIYKSEDGGAHWRRLEGLPAGSLGRIGLAVARGSGGATVYASIAVEGSALTTAAAPRGKAGLYRSDDGGATWQLVNDDPSLASSYFGRVTVAPNDPNVVYVMGRSIRRSSDGGRHFDIIVGAPGGDDYHFLWINPTDPSHMITGTDQGAVVTVNGGVSWSSWYNQPTGQFYHLAADDRFPYHIYSGQQDNGTVEIASRGPYGAIEGRDWHPVGGDERDYMVPQPGNPDLVFGSGLGGHVSRFDEATRQAAEISPWPVSTYGARPTTVRYRFTWITPLVFSPRPPHAMYLGAQVLFRSVDNGDHWTVASPDLSGATPGAKDCDRPDLAGARACGFGVIFAIAPSPLAARLLWVGTDDGVIQRSSDGGAHWRNVTPAIAPLWGTISTIAPSPFDTSVAYVAVDTHRLDRFVALILKTADGGRHWQSISHGIPAGEYVSVVRADPERRGLLYAGTNRGVYLSQDDGATWQSLSLNLPTTWVRDLLVHQGDLIAATQGRGIWVLDDVEPLREDPAVLAQPVHLFRPAPAWRLSGNENRDTPWPPSTPLGENPPTGAVIDYSLRSAPAGPARLTLRDAAGRVVRRFASDAAPEELPADRYFEVGWLGEPPRLSAAPGMHRFVWDLRYPRPAALKYEYSIAAVWQRGAPLDPQGPLALPGRYSVTLTVDGKDYTQPLTVRLDPRVHATAAALGQQLALAQAVDSALALAVATHAQIGRVLEQKKESAPAAFRDSLTALADGGDSSFAGLAGVFANLATAVQSADGAPTQGERAVFAAYRRKLDRALVRWRGWAKP